MPPSELRKTIKLDEESKQFMRLAMSRLNLSARVFDRIQKVGRTIADLHGIMKETDRYWSRVSDGNRSLHNPD